MTPITIETTLNQPIEKIWDYWTNPEHITHWMFASDDWCAPSAENDLIVGGKFKTRMESRDGTEGFDMEGIYTEVKQYKSLAYEFGDRKARVEFIPVEGGIKIIETFDPETENPVDMQRSGWQAILDNFKKYAQQ